jgi:uncharacterized protein YodC (DUF2158 family)
MAFKTGDVVQLKSGGPKMTVDCRIPDSTDKLICKWFEGKEVRTEVFREDMLIVPPPPPTPIVKIPRERGF